MFGEGLICLQRQSCVDKAREVLKEPTDVGLDEYVTDRFLCSGGSSGYRDAVSCKGLGLRLHILQVSLQPTCVSVI